MEPELVCWDWKGQAPMGKIAALVGEMSRHGQVFMREAPSEYLGDSYMWIISGRELSDDELAELLAR